MNMLPAEKKQHDLDVRYMRMARIWAENSYCKRRRVGALIVKDKMIISDGYNGTPSGFENVCEDENNVTKPYVLHAEANAITKIARSGNNSDGATLYVTTSPCIECAKLIIQAGIRRVIYGEKYRIEDGINLLKRANIDVEYVSVDEEGKVLPADDPHRFFEASWMHKYKGKYYFSYSTGDTHYLCYAVGDNPYGPFTYKGVILEPVVGWTTHHSICEYKGQWYLFHHDCVPSNDTTWLRSVKVAPLFYDEEGNILPVK